MTMNRQKIENAIHALIDLLDAMDGDENLECTGDDEYTLAGSHTDREHDRADDEMSLGWTLNGAMPMDLTPDREGDGVLQGGSQICA